MTKQGFDVGDCVIVRSRSASPFYGIFAARVMDDGEISVRLTQARRIWGWKGAATLSGLATEGTSKPKECRFPGAVEFVEVTRVDAFKGAVEPYFKDV